MKRVDSMKCLHIAWDNKGLIPCITQDSISNEVLMLAYMNEEALNLTLQTGIAHYFSRSKQRIWKKGEQSGNIQEVCEIKLDCDSDSILLRVRQKGVACHTGEFSCFFKNIDSINKDCANNNLEITKDSLTHSLNTYDTLDTLYHTLLERKNADSTTSYTASLFAKGTNAIAKKIIEEAGEFCFALKDRDSKEIIYECADVFYHILVGLASENIHPDRIYQELIKRMGVSGIAEKQSRIQTCNEVKDK